jgi:hypothetical protein
MITGEIKSQVDRLCYAFWSGGISDPLEVIEQITYRPVQSRRRRCSDLCYLAATAAATGFKRRSPLPVELPRAASAHCDLVNPKVNALASTFIDAAIAGARKAERRDARGAATGALETLPGGRRGRFTCRRSLQ